ncbi:MAG: DEAD/DEAH box helicase [bacterium]
MELESIFIQNEEFNKLKKLIDQGIDKDYLVISGVPIALRETLLSKLNVQTGKNFWYSNISTKGIQNLIKSAYYLEEKQISFTRLTDILDRFKYSRVVKASEIGEFSVKGDTIFIKSYAYPIGTVIVATFFGDKLESLELVDEIDHTKKTKITGFVVFSNGILLDNIERKAISYYGDIKNSELNDVFVIFADLLETDIIFDFSYPPIYYNHMDLLTKDIYRYLEKSFTIYFSLPEKKIEKVKELLNENQKNNKNIKYISNSIASGFVSNSMKVLLLTEKELFATLDLSLSKVKSKSNSFFDENVVPGDYVVHEDYGVAIYQGVSRPNESKDEYLLLEYAMKDRLFIPFSQANRITKYIGEDGIKPLVTRLGKGEWATVTKNIKKSIQIIAKELLEHMAIQEISKAKVIKEESKDYFNMCDDFEFELTPDQKQSLLEISSDLSQSKPMNRLLVGDVGFGKTEVALRAAFKAIEAGLQVAILCPTTILCYQHYSLLQKRFSKYAVNVGMLSSFNTTKENTEVVEKVRTGSIDIVVGTHRLLSKDIKIEKLGLLIIDEEQRFGVKQKEKIKALRYGVHVLSMSATPIPRTLSLALSKIQALSIINTPPEGRKAVITKVAKLDWEKISEVIKTEVNRGGQVYFVHNRVVSIGNVKAKLQAMLPDVKFGLAHGQMVKHKKSSKDLIDILEENSLKPSTLEKTIIDFYFKRFDVLICTTIIENGIDMPNVNTIIIDKAQNLGLSELYQLRGRVGRSSKQAYCYAFYEGIKIEEKDIQKEDIYIEVPKDEDEKAYVRRLKTLMESQELGSGFKVATRDLQIRGAGNILGKEQSGKINLIGYGLYITLLEQEIEKQRNSKLIISPLEFI